MKLALLINNKQELVDVDPGLRLIHVLRNNFQLCSPKIGCMRGRCGTCMILLNGKPVFSCILPVAIARDCSITTLEGFKEHEIYLNVQAALKQLNINLCGFCDTSKYFAAYEILTNNLRPAKEYVYEKIKTLECSCIDTEQFIDVILLAAAIQRKKKNAAK